MSDRRRPESAWADDAKQDDARVTDSLGDLGFDDFFREAWDARTDERGEPARVVGTHRREWDVATERGVERAVLAGRRWRGAQKKHEAQPTVGDWVVLVRPGVGQDPVVADVLPRKTVLHRATVAGRDESQAVVANIDLVAVVAAFAVDEASDAIARRSLNPRRIERYLTAIRAGGALPLVLLNKSDLMADAEAHATTLSERLGTVPVLPVSTLREDGLTTLTPYLRARTTLGLVGLSGVGKSSIVNHLMGSMVQRVAEIRGNDARGRHTTTHRQMFRIAGGAWLIDTPGMREFALGEVTEDDLSAFQDVTELAQGCRFRDCSHRSEPGCAVREAIALGKLEEDRVRSYLTLAGEVASSARRARRPTRGRRPRPDDQGDDWER